MQPEDNANASAIDLNPIPPDTSIESTANDAYTADDPAIKDAVPAPIAEDKSPTDKLSSLEALNKALDKPTDEAAKAADDAAGKKPETPAAEDKTKPNELYQMPKGATGEARAKFKALAEHAESQDKKIAEYESRVNEIQQHYSPIDEVIQDSRAGPEQMALAFQFISAVNSGDWNAALQIIEGERQELAKLAGRSLEGVDLLDEFPDLKDAVASMALTKEHAEEVASARRLQQRHAHGAEVYQQQQQQREAHQQNEQQRHAAVADAGKWEKEMLSKDIDAPTKLDAIRRYMESAAGAKTLQTIPPAMWRAHLQSIYDSLLAPTRVPVSSRSPTPIRPAGGGGNVKPTGPMSSLDALNRALGYN